MNREEQMYQEENQLLDIDIYLKEYEYENYNGVVYK